MRTTNDSAQKVRVFSGSWTIYRRQEDAQLWERFELDCIERGMSPSEALAKLVRNYHVSNR